MKGLGSEVNGERQAGRERKLVELSPHVNPCLALAGTSQLREFLGDQNAWTCCVEFFATTSNVCRYGKDGAVLYVLRP